MPWLHKGIPATQRLTIYQPFQLSATSTTRQPANMLAASQTFVASTHAGRRQAVVARAAPRASTVSKTIEQAATAFLAAGVAVGLSLGAPSPALARLPVSLEQKNREREEAVQAQLARLEYAFEQQQNAARADIAGKRQQLENTAEQVNTAIQRKLIEQAANEQAAAKKGDEARALRIEQEAKSIKAQEAQLQVAVAKAEAQIDREAMVEKAREVEQQQEIKKAEGSFMDLLGLSKSDLGL